MNAPSPRESKCNRRVAIVLLNLHRGGAELQAVALARHLRPLGWEPVFYLLHDAGDLREEVRREFTLRAMTVRAHLSKRSPGFWLDVLRAICQLTMWFRQDRIAVVHSLLFWSSAYAVPAAWLARVRGVVTCRLQLAEFKNRRRHYDRIEGILNRFTHAVMVNAAALKRETVRRERIPSRKVVVIRNGVASMDAANATPVDLPSEFPTLSGTGPVIAVVANLKPIKRHDVFLRAFALAHDAMPTFRAILIGADQGEGRSLRVLAEELRIADAVVFAGERDDVPAVLRACPIAALTSDGEGLPNALMEAMVAGCGIVATCVGGVPELIRHGEHGLLARAGDHEEIARHLLLLARDVERRSRLGASATARIRSAEFTLTQLAESHVRLWNHVYLFREAPR